MRSKQASNAIDRDVENVVTPPLFAALIRLLVVHGSLLLLPSLSHADFRDCSNLRKTGGYKSPPAPCGKDHFEFRTREFKPNDTWTCCVWTWQRPGGEEKKLCGALSQAYWSPDCRYLAVSTHVLSHINTASLFDVRDDFKEIDLEALYVAAISGKKLFIQRDGLHHDSHIPVKWLSSSKLVLSRYLGGYDPDPWGIEVVYSHDFAKGKTTIVDVKASGFGPKPKRKPKPAQNHVIDPEGDI